MAQYEPLNLYILSEGIAVTLASLTWFLIMENIICVTFI
jgi:hypothetical protein